MPISRKFAKLRRTDLETLSEGQRSQLEDGKCFQFLDGYTNADELRLAWDIHGAEILSEYIATCPGNRPFAWWLCDHKQERPIVNNPESDGTPLIPQSCIETYRAEKFGFLDTSIWVGLDDNDQPITFQEPQHVYLRRLKLLTPDELQHPDLESEAL